MFTLSPPAIAMAVGVIAFIALMMLLISPRDTLRGVGEFFDWTIFRRLLRSVRRSGRFSLMTLVVVTAVLPPILALFVRISGLFALPDVALMLLGALWVAAVLVPLIYWFFGDAFGRGPREQWRKYLDDDPR